MVQIIENRMTPENFAYWLQGMLEGNPDLDKKGLTKEQAKMIQEHLNLVFNKVTPTTFTVTGSDTIFQPDINNTILC